MRNLPLPEPGHEMRMAGTSQSLAVISEPVPTTIYINGRMVDGHHMKVMMWDTFANLCLTEASQDRYDNATWEVVVTDEDLDAAVFM